MEEKNVNVKEVKNEKLKISTILLSYVLFIGLWTLRVVYLKTSGLNEYLGWSIGFFVHVICWPVFAFIYIKIYSNKLNISLKEMLTTIPKMKLLILSLLFVLAYNVIGYFIDSSGYGTSMKTYDLIITVLTVGIFEESVFRGWYLNAFSSHMSERKANVISSLLFVFIHYPGWICAGYNVSTITSVSIPVFILGLFFGYLFRKNRSIWTCSIVHSVWDCITWIL